MFDNISTDRKNDYVFLKDKTDEGKIASIQIANNKQILDWSHGEVKKSETINYRTFKPEKYGLFCETIFGTTKEYECSCGKYKGVRFKNIRCEKCHVEITSPSVRRERMGHIELGNPIVHIWYFKNSPNYIGYILDVPMKHVDNIIYYISHIYYKVDTEAINRDKDKLLQLLEETKKEAIESEKSYYDLELEDLKDSETKKIEVETRFKDKIASIEEYYRELWEHFISIKQWDLESNESRFNAIVELFGDYIEGGIGANGIEAAIRNIDLDKEILKLKNSIKTSNRYKHSRNIKRLGILMKLKENPSILDGIILKRIPVIPPDLRPMVQLDGGRFASSDLNDLYRFLINRNIRSIRLKNLHAPKVVIYNEYRMLQEAVDALYDNTRRTRPVMGTQKLPLKSLSDLLKGKQGRFRQNLLGKRVDYSGRSVIVIGPELKLNECGLPIAILSELFKPVLVNRLVELGYANNEKMAKQLILANHPTATEALAKLIKHKYVLLNRAPTLHKLSIQAFSPKIVNDNAIRIHPLVCNAFNADFDGDQMAVHLPVTIESQAEAQVLMSPQHNLRSPINGKLVTILNNDMVLGIYWLTREPLHQNKDNKNLSFFSSFRDLDYAFQSKNIGIHDKVQFYLKNHNKEKALPEDRLIVTTYGRVLFNETIANHYEYVNEQINKKRLSEILNTISDQVEPDQVMNILDNLKDLGFYWAMHSETSIGINDTLLPIDKIALIKKYEDQVKELTSSYSMGFITKSEYEDGQITIWTEATDEIMDLLKKHFHLLKPFYAIVESGARGNITQMRQLVGMRGLIFNARNKTIVKPIKNNFIEGLNITEYFISTHGARKGLADTALRTADSGYLTRRLVDVCQNIIILLDDCGTKVGLDIPLTEKHAYTRYLHEDIENLFYNRYLAKDVQINDRIFERNTLLKKDIVDFFLNHKVGVLSIRSPLKCEASFGICKKCYGYLLSSNKDAEIGDCVGVIAAQSIGEPGTQLTMQTFHTGGVAKEDITLGLPRIIELFEGRKNEGENSLFTEITGKVYVEEDDNNPNKFYITVREHGGDNKKPRVCRYTYTGSAGSLKVNNNQEVIKGEALTYTNLNQHEVLNKLGPNYAQLYILNEIQKVYHSHGVFIHCKHIDIIMRKMFSQIEIVESDYDKHHNLSIMDKIQFIQYNNENINNTDQEKKKSLIGRMVITGITKCSLITDSWLSAASFQETTRILMNAAFNRSIDRLVGLKENIIIGEAIPAGTGLKRNNNISVRVLNKAFNDKKGNKDDK